MGGFAIIGGPEEKPPSIYVANQGKLAEIATRYIQKANYFLNVACGYLCQFALIGYVDGRGFFLRAPDNSETAHCEMAFGLSAQTHPWCVGCVWSVSNIASLSCCSV